MRRRQAIQEREQLRRMLNVERAEMPASAQNLEPVALVDTVPDEPIQPKRRGRPRKVKDDNAS